MSYQHWELLTRMATGRTADLLGVCRELVRQSDVERLFCIVRRGQLLQVQAVDCDGYPLGYAEQRLRDSEFRELPFDGGGPGGEVTITRRISRASKRTSVIGAVQLASGWAVTLVLENRFSGRELATVDDQTVEQWVVLVALAVRLEAAGPPEASGRDVEGGVPSLWRRDARPPVGANARDERATGGETTDSGPHQAKDSEPDLPSADTEAQRLETLSALESQRWNISRAARALGMTRHGLKKRMRRLQVARPG